VFVFGHLSFYFERAFPEYIYGGAERRNPSFFNNGLHSGPISKQQKTIASYTPSITSYTPSTKGKDKYTPSEYVN